jgi:hypothetical protein
MTVSSSALTFREGDPYAKARPFPAPPFDRKQLEDRIEANDIGLTEYQCSQRLVLPSLRPQRLL